VREMCQKVVECKSEPEAVELVRQLKQLIHARISRLRDNLTAVPENGL